MSKDSSESNDELMSQFMAFTGSIDATKAAQYLEMSGGNLETAVGLYMEHEQGNAGDSFGASQPPRGGGRSARGSTNSTDRGVAVDPTADIRAPDATRTMRLMEDDMMGPVHAEYHLLSAMMDQQLARSAFAIPSDNRDVRAAINAASSSSLQRNISAPGRLGEEKQAQEDEEGDDEEDEDEDAQLISSGPTVPAGLSDLFAPPEHLIQKTGGFVGVRAIARDSKRWLLVNIQRDSEFASHALNRDVWRDELVENLIREGFIFWQQMDVTPEGRTYVERYQVHDFPHVAIIDPRTGRLMWRKEGWTQERPLTAEDFAETAMDFCSRNSFDRPPQAPRPTQVATAAVRPAKRPMHELSEDEQLQAAMRASMEEMNGGDDMDDVVVVDDADGGEYEEVEYVGTHDAGTVMIADDEKPPATETKPPSMIDDLLKMSVGDEPAQGARIQLRMPDGKRIVRKFANTDSVRNIYAFVAQSNDETRAGREFILMAGFPPSDLINDVDKTVEACNLAGQAVVLRWKE